jgi:hypothetical protein
MHQSVLGALCLGSVRTEKLCAIVRADSRRKLETIGKLNLLEDVKSLSLGLELANAYGLPTVTIATEKLRASIIR